MVTELIGLFHDPTTRDIVGWVATFLLIGVIDRRLHALNTNLAIHNANVTSTMDLQTKRMEEIRRAMMWLAREHGGPHSDAQHSFGESHAGDQGSIS